MAFLVFMFQKKIGLGSYSVITERLDDQGNKIVIAFLAGPSANPKLAQEITTQMAQEPDSASATIDKFINLAPQETPIMLITTTGRKDHYGWPETTFYFNKPDEQINTVIVFIHEKGVFWGINLLRDPEYAGGAIQTEPDYSQLTACRPGCQFVIATPGVFEPWYPDINNQYTGIRPLDFWPIERFLTDNGLPDRHIPFLILNRKVYEQRTKVLQLTLLNSPKSGQIQFDFQAETKFEKLSKPKNILPRDSACLYLGNS